MRKILLLIIPIFTFLSCNKELEDNLTSIDTWKWSNSRTINGTMIKIVEIKEISFRNNTLVNYVSSNGDTLLYDKINFTWESSFPSTIKLLEDGKKYKQEIGIHNEFRAIDRR